METYKKIPEQALNTYYEKSYGLFSGGQTEVATVKFCQSIAHRVADEQWHPEQKGKTLNSGEYQMEIPYNSDNPSELIKDLLALGNNAEVLSPDSLRFAMYQHLKNALAKYEKNSSKYKEKRI